MSKRMNPPGAPFAPRNLVLVAMIALAVGVRLVIHFMPGLLPYNFTPVEAIALFGGAFFADRRLALLVPLGAMFLSDLVIGLHPLIPLIYACIALTVWAGGALRQRASAVRVAVAAVASTTGFFLVTNFAVWLTSGMYPLTGSGLGACFAAGIPFYQWQLLGSLGWSAALFGGFALLSQRYGALKAQPQAA
ncbi:MAG TPA: DUF6580 family putative transport protein [Rhodanobacteraceae bacterium]|nr:DUF6580 family putative transport protein [Rhodanobacteraceae bacterium]